MFRKQSFEIRRKIKSDYFDRSSALSANAGLRAIAKLCLNSLWGKYGQQNIINQCKYATDISEFYQIVLDVSIDSGIGVWGFFREELVGKGMAPLQKSAEHDDWWRFNLVMTLSFFAHIIKTRQYNSLYLRRE